LCSETPSSLEFETAGAGGADEADDIEAFAAESDASSLAGISLLGLEFSFLFAGGFSARSAAPA
jgi:hypothetical protein